MRDADLCLRPATELAALVRTRELSAAELLAAHLEQIERVNPRVNAICTLDAEGATAAAARLDAEWAAGAQPGPLAGLPVVVKDLIDVAGLPTTRGSPIYRDAVADHDDLMVQRMRAAGALIVGKSNVPEFGAGSHTLNTVFGVTRNPYDLGRSAGGSSGGGAAALTSGMVAVADGSDYGGSIRNPPNFNSVVGLRPTPGRVPKVPGDPWETLSVLGPMGRTVADAALLLSAIAGPDRRDPTSICESAAPFANIAPRDLKGCRVAYSRDLGVLPVEPAVSEAIERALPLLADLGCIVEQAHPDLSGGAEAFDTIRALRFAGDHAATLRDHRDQLKATVIWNIERGLALTTDQVIRAHTGTRRAVPAHERVPGTVRRADPAGLAGGAVPGRDRLAALHWRRAHDHVHRLDAELLADHHDFAPGAVAALWFHPGGPAGGRPDRRPLPRRGGPAGLRRRLGSRPRHLHPPPRNGALR